MKVGYDWDCTFYDNRCMTCRQVPVHVGISCAYKVESFCHVGDREVLDNSVADQNSNNEPQHEPAVRNADEEVAGSAEPPPRPEPQLPAVAGPSSSADGPVRPSQDLDSLIARMQRDMDMRLARGSVDDPPFSPPPHEPEQQAEGSHSSNTYHFKHSHLIIIDDIINCYHPFLLPLCE